jgi:hypothetical protein
MALSISIPDSAWSSQSITLGGSDYNITLTWNDRDSRWRFSLLQDEVSIVSGIKLVENQSLLSRYILPDFLHGDIFVLRSKQDGQFVGRDNLGIGKAYELVYFTNEELEAIGGN